MNKMAKFVDRIYTQLPLTLFRVYRPLLEEAIKEIKAEAWAEGFKYGTFPDSRFTYEDLLARNPYLTPQHITHNLDNFMEISG
jgi:hypothetical protein